MHGGQACANPPELAGKALHPHIRIILLFYILRAVHSGRPILLYEKSLDPHSTTPTAIYYLYEPVHTEFFGTRGCLGRGAWLWTRGRAGGHADATRGGGRAGCLDGGENVGYEKHVA